MRIALATAALLAAGILALSGPARAADLGYVPQEPVYGDADDPVYGEATDGTDYYEDSIRRGGNEYAEAVPERDYVYPGKRKRHGLKHRNGYADGRCMQRWQIEDTLSRQGWKRFQGLELDPDVVGVTATRPNGLVYRLKIDRCSGIIISAYLLDQPDRRNVYTSQSNYAPSY